MIIGLMKIMMADNQLKKKDNGVSIEELFSKLFDHLKKRFNDQLLNQIFSLQSESVFSVFGKRFRESNFDYDDFRFQITNLFVIIIINNILIKFILIFGSDPADRPYTGWCPFIIRFNRIQRCLNSEPIWTESVG